MDKSLVFFSTLINASLCSIYTINNLGGFSLMETIGAMLFTNFPIYIYLLRKKGKKKNEFTFMFLQNILVLIALYGLFRAP